MISTYTPLGSVSRTFVYPISVRSVASSPITISPSTYIPEAHRALYGYTSTSNRLKAVEIRLVNVNVECPVASAMNVQAAIAISSSSPGFTAIGNRSYNICAPLARNIGSVTSLQTLQSPSSMMFILDVPGALAGYSFTISIINSNTGAAISTGDYVMYNLEYTEYLSN